MAKAFDNFEIDKICKYDDEKVNELLNNKDIISYSFVAWAISAKPNSKNKNIIREKEIVESWLDENSPQYRKRKSRPDTKSSYFKSIIKYYSLVIVQSNK